MVAEVFEPLEEVFNKFLLNKDRIFKNREILKENFIPFSLIHREKQYLTISIALKTAYEQKNSFIFCYGNAGTGKTSLILNFLNNLPAKYKELGIQVPIIATINCKLNTTNYRILVNLCHIIGISVPKAYSLNQLFYRFKKEIDEKKQFLVIFLDEIDNLFIKNTKKTNNVTLLFEKMNNQFKNTRFCIIGISYNLNFKKNLSSQFLSEINIEKCEFYPYTANELQNILSERMCLAFFPGVVSQGIINLIAAFAAQTGGDARYALSLLLKAGELAERNGETELNEEHIKNVHKILKNTNIKKIFSE